ncbi:MAG TPA: 50S ribosomal protein L21 [Candidatus Saccharimonadales bacterium]|nr:50S ribosomal protein L21 [Candidatus Saccharimonadales bacterium]
MKAVIEVGNRQYLVEKDQIIDAELLHVDKKTIDFSPLLIIDGNDIKVGTPRLDEAKVTAEIVESEIKTQKTTAIRHKAKKRVHKTRGHRQRNTRLRITKIA